jgi:hypothetical protein
MSVKVHFPLLPLQDAITLPGGITRDCAVAAAQENLRAINGEVDMGIESAIQALEVIVGSAVEGCLAPDQLRAVLDQADQVVNIAGTFGYETLDQASRGLCDIADGLLREGRNVLAPVAVHVRAMRLFSPLRAALPAEDAARILAELHRVAAHYNCGPITGA